MKTIIELEALQNVYHTTIDHRCIGDNKVEQTFTKGKRYRVTFADRYGYQVTNDNGGVSFVVENFDFDKNFIVREFRVDNGQPDVWFIADNHHNHSNIISFCNRPYSDVKQMDKELIANWNSVVEKTDKVYVLGDFSFYNKEETSKILSQLKGDKMLILGNHDDHSPQWYRDCGFKEVSQYPIVIEGYWMLSHEPMFVNENTCYANIYGHVHNNEAYADYSAHTFCVSVERINYTPINFRTIKRKMEAFNG